MSDVILPRGRTKKKECPNCGGEMSKKAYTCMPCYRRGHGQHNSSPQVSPRFNKELQQKWRAKVEQLKHDPALKSRNVIKSKRQG
jgi:hypothetical protein